MVGAYWELRSTKARGLDGPKLAIGAADDGVLTYMTFPGQHRSKQY